MFYGANDRQSSIELQAKGGITYYVRMELVTGFMKGHGRLILIQPEQGGVEIKKLQYLGSDKIKDRSLVKDRP